MSELKIKDKEVVVPGEELASGMDYLPSFGTYRDNQSIVASRLGLASVDGKVIKIIPLSGAYLPKRGDTVIGKVVDILMSGWRLELNSAYSAMLGLRDATSDFIQKGADLTRWFEIDDYIVAKITNVTSQKLVDLTTKMPGLRKLRGGRIIEVNPYKVPRVIGKSGSMVSMIKLATGCKIMVGQNGLIWIQGDDMNKETLAVKTIELIEKEAHKQGLTDRIKAFLEKETGVKLDTLQQTNMHDNRGSYENNSNGNRNSYNNNKDSYDNQGSDENNMQYNEEQ